MTDGAEDPFKNVSRETILRLDFLMLCCVGLLNFRRFAYSFAWIYSKKIFLAKKCAFFLKIAYLLLKIARFFGFKRRLFTKILFWLLCKTPDHVQTVKMAKGRTLHWIRLDQWIELTTKRLREDFGGLKMRSGVALVAFRALLVDFFWRLFIQNRKSVP